MLNIVIPIWSFVKSGGMRVLAKFANSFLEKGYKVVVITYYKSEKPYFPFNCEIQYINDNGETVERIEPKKQNKLYYAYEKYLKYKALKNALNRLSNEYNIAIANYNLTAFPVAKSNIKNKFYYIQAYEAWGKGFKGEILNILAKKSYKLNLKKIVNAELYLDYKEIKSEYIVPPGLDLNLYYPKAESAYWDNCRPFIIGHIGRSEEWKGSKDVANAIKILQREGINIKYRVAFNPPDVNNCDFELVKPDGDKNLSEYYRNVDVLIAPCTIQLGAIHYPVIEAMACGTPVITTGYYPANQNNAYIVGINAPKEIAEAIKKIMKNYTLAKDKAEVAKNDIQAFSWENVTNKMDMVITENSK